jgi:metal-responsive CopG/Arc/MetJ family transcriptional regulator
MKTAISIADSLLNQADETARAMGLSRSGFFALAASEFLERQQQEQILRRLNDVHATGMEPSEKRLLTGMERRVGRTAKERW